MTAVVVSLPSMPFECFTRWRYLGRVMKVLGVIESSGTGTVEVLVRHIRKFQGSGELCVFAPRKSFSFSQFSWRPLANIIHRRYHFLL